MWPKKYKDYPEDELLIKYEVEPGDGIVGCEMHEFNGWGETRHVSKKHSKNVFQRLMERLFGKS
jgi:hypothetical protein